MLPDFFRSKAQNRCKPTYHGLDNMVHRSLAGTAGKTVLLSGVLAILNDIEIKTTEVNNTEVKDFLINQMELEITVSIDNFLLQ